MSEPHDLSPTDERADHLALSSCRPPTTLAQLLAAPDQVALMKLMHERVRFHSPVTDYEGCSTVAHLLLTIPTVVSEIQIARQLTGKGELTSFLMGRVRDQRVEAVMDELYDEAGAVIDATLMLRPLAALHTAIELMKEALRGSPVHGEL